MVVFLLQIWGGLFYLLNKIFFSRMERSRDTRIKQMWRSRSWCVYLAGLPAWIIVFVMEHNWIAAAVESGGAPAMISGLIAAHKGRGKEPGWLDGLARLTIGAGLLLSVLEFGGIRTLSQFLELGIAAGFLMGTYMAAKQRIQGYGWLMLGNVTCAALMGIQGYYVLMGQQMVSLVFVADALITRLSAGNVNVRSR